MRRPRPRGIGGNPDSRPPAGCGDQVLIDSDSSVWFAKLIVFGELAIGLGLIVGAFVGVAAFFGALMNMNFMLAGSASTNPVLFFLAVGLMLAWKVAGYYGLDRVLLPLVGTPWHGYVREEAAAPIPRARSAPAA